MSRSLPTSIDLRRVVSHRATISGIPRVAARQLIDDHGRDEAHRWRAEFDRALFGDTTVLVVDLATVREHAARLAAHRLTEEERANLVTVIEDTIVRAVAALTGNAR